MKEADLPLQLEMCVQGLCLPGWDVQLLSTHSPLAHQIGVCVLRLMVEQSHPNSRNTPVFR